MPVLWKRLAAVWSLISSDSKIFLYSPASSIRPFPIISSFFPCFVRLMSNMSVSAFVMGQHDSLFTHYIQQKCSHLCGRGCIVYLYASATENMYLISVYGMMCWLSLYLLFDYVSYTYWGSSYQGWASGFGIVCGWLSYMLLILGHS